jgi:dimethylhistidine N-methyltransferase
MRAERKVELQGETSSDQDDFRLAVVEGLSKAHKSLPCRYFYDARGSELFEQITELPEYYPTRTEAGILARCAADIARAIPPKSVLVEFGAGSSLKTEILLDQVAEHVTYVPIDVSPSALAAAAQRLVDRYPSLDVRPIVADFSQPIALPQELEERPRTGFFPGSTIGNLTRPEVINLLSAFGAALGADSKLIIGVDLKKDARRLVLAYNDSAGVTAAFNLNLLARINRELEGTIDLDAFRHDAIYNPREGRIEMHLISLRDHDATIAGHRFRFREGESIHTENSYKYTVDEFQGLARKADWHPKSVWTDDDTQFSVHILENRAGVDRTQAIAPTIKKGARR